MTHENELLRRSIYGGKTERSGTWEMMDGEVAHATEDEHSPVEKPKSSRKGPRNLSLLSNVLMLQRGSTVRVLELTTFRRPVGR